MSNVLLTGGAGFIGSNLCRALKAQGHHVSVVDDMSNGHKVFIHGHYDSLYQMSFDDPVILCEIESGKYDVVFHLAALPRVSFSVDYPDITHDVNVNMTVKLLNAVKKHRSTAIVFSSSSSVYGGAEVLPTPVSTPHSPKSPYALHKSVIEQYINLYRSLYGLRATSLRYFNVFGPNQLGSSPYSTAVSAWLTAIFKDQSCRSDGDGSQTRDMCYVDNVVLANIRAAEALLAGRDIDHAYNVATGNRVSNAAILAHLEMIYQDRVKIKHAPWRAGDVMHTQADVSTLGNLGIKQEELVGFWDGLARTMAWAEEHVELLRMGTAL